MSDLVDWLRGALDTHEQIARAAARQISEHGWHDGGGMCAEEWDYIEAFDPAFALRTVQAHREILDRHSPRKVMNNDGVRVIGLECAHCIDGSDTWGGPTHEDWPCPDVRSLAAIYAETHPGFDPSWIEERSAR
jgi:hypothetical protein